MGFKAIIRRLLLLRRVSLFKFIRWNFFCRNVRRHGKGFIFPYRGAVIAFGRGSRIDIYDEHFSINGNKPRASRAEALVILRKNARLVIEGGTSLSYGATIEVHEDAVVEMKGVPIINTGTVILAAKRITIGRGVIIARQVLIYDSDHHSIYNESGELANPPREVVIGDHVWLGLRSTVLCGSRIGDGAVIGAGSLVKGNIEPGFLVKGNSAKACSAVNWSTAKNKPPAAEGQVPSEGADTRAGED